jgi:hypothetical protein
MGKGNIGGVFMVLAASIIICGVGALNGATVDNLQNLTTTGGTLQIGDKIFSNCRFGAHGLTSFDPTTIQVTVTEANGIDYLTWAGNMSLVSGTGTGAFTADLVLNYTVVAVGGAIDAIDASFTGSAQPNGGAFLAVDETARGLNGNIVGTTHLEGQQRSDTFSLSSPQNFLMVTKDISFGISNGGLTTVSEVVQSFHQVGVPEPSTISLLTGGGFIAAVFFLRRRRS